MKAGTTLPYATVLGANAIVGGVLSIRTTAVAFDPSEPRAFSVWAPSPVSMIPPAGIGSNEPPSTLTVMVTPGVELEPVTLTLVVYQPPVPCVPLGLSVIEPVDVGSGTASKYRPLLEL